MNVDEMRTLLEDVVEMLDTGAAFVSAAGHDSTAAAMFDKADDIRAALKEIEGAR